MPTPPPETMIQVSGLRKTYGSIDAVKGIDFEIKKGEIVGFLGPNGAGKSTTLKMMTTYLAPTAGSIRIAGLDIMEKPREVRRKFGYLPESAPIYTDMTAYDYLKFVGSLRGISGKELEKRVALVAGKVGITDVIGQVNGTLSKGYRQRVCLAQALIHNPEILVLDEPTVGLDPNQVVEIRSLIRELGKDRTVILSTHILPEVLVTCDRILIIHHGTIVADGTPKELQKEQHENPSVLLKLQGSLPPETIEQVLLEQPFVAEVNHRLSASSDEMDFEVVGQGDADLRAQLATLTRERGWPLLELKRETLDLEGLFRKLTQE